MQLALGWQCAYCRKTQIGSEFLGETTGWYCAPFPEGLPLEYNQGKTDCPYREAQSEDHWVPTGIAGTVRTATEISSTAINAAIRGAAGR